MRRSLRRTALLLGCMAVMAVTLAQDGGASQDVYDELDPVLIVGETAPPLWKLTKKGHVLWIMGTFRPQLRSFRMNSQRLDKLIAASQEVIFPGAAYTASVGTRAMPAALQADRIPGGGSLQNLLPADAYANWVALRQKYPGGTFEGTGPKFTWGGKGANWVTMTEPYRGGDAIDTMRPTLAWEGLRRAAMDRYGLVSYDLEAMVEAVAKKHAVPVRKLHFGREFIFIWKRDPLLDSLRDKDADVAAIASATDYGDLACLQANIDLLEPVLDMRKVQAAAWARGDLNAMKSADSAIRLRDCVTELVAAVSAGRLPGSADAKEAMDRYYTARRDSNKEVLKGWVNAMQGAVKKNKITFTMVPIEDLLAEDGYLARLIDKDFVVELSGLAAAD